MSSGESSTLSPLWARWYRRALPAYWVSLFIATHLPKLSFGRHAPRWSDKVAHFAAFAVLAFFYWRFWQALFGRVSGRFVWISTGVLLAYAAVDEHLQQFVHRSPELGDWALDVAGVGIVLIGLEWQRRSGISNRPEALDSRAADS